MLGFYFVFIQALCVKGALAMITYHQVFQPECLSLIHIFSLIGEKMKKINLGKNNEPIQWNRNDEIGSLVNEYNRMLAKLDESAAALAKTEREGAWREMAKQVAHEIKNPLTPMKLSMQFLQRSIETNAPGVEALTASVVHTRVEQICLLYTSRCV